MSKENRPKPENSQLEQKKTTLVAKTTQVWSAPLPPPDALERYNQIVPGAAGEILEMAKRIQKHRIEIENRTHTEAFVVHKTDQKQRGLALWFAFILAGLGLVIAAGLAYQGKLIAAGIFGAFGLTVIISKFLLRSDRKREEP